MNRKLLLYIAAVAIIQPLTLQAKQKVISPKNITTKSSHAKKNIAAPIPSQPIDSTYFLQLNIAENDCEKILGQSCFFRDKMLSDPYLHETTLTIFLNKIFATQSFNDKTITAQVKDGTYSLASNNDNLISFNTKDGEVSNLKLIKGDLTKEQNNISKCRKAENLYNFYNLYKSSEILTKSGTYKDEYDFKGLNEYILFAEKTDQAEIMALTKSDESRITAVENLQLCKMPNANILNVRHLSAEECSGDDKTTEECCKYQECENVIAVEDCEVTLFKDGFN